VVLRRPAAATVIVVVMVLLLLLLLLLLDASAARHHPAAGQRQLGPFAGQRVIDVHLVQDEVALFARPPVPQPDPARLQPHRLVRVLERRDRRRGLQRHRRAFAAAVTVAWLLTRVPAWRV